MAIRDVKKYYIDLLTQYIEVKNDLADFEQALKDGHITEDQLADAKEDVEKIKVNLDRIAYIIFLLNLPNKKKKQEQAIKRDKNLLNYFKESKSDEDGIIQENIDILKHLRDELKRLKENETV